MKKILIIMAHPDLTRSHVNKLWHDTLTQFPQQFYVHDLYKTYPDENINVQAEQSLVEAYDTIIFQFPFYWFSTPPLLKKWQDVVLTYGWAFGSNGNQLKDKTIGIAVSAGICQQDYSEQGRYHYTMEEMLRPLETTIKYVKANYYPHFVFHGTEGLAEHNEQNYQERLAQSTQDYLTYLNHMANKK